MLRRKSLLVVGAGSAGKQHTLAGQQSSFFHRVDSLPSRAIPSITPIGPKEFETLHLDDFYSHIVIAGPASAHAFLAKALVPFTDNMLIEKPIAHLMDDAVTISEIERNYSASISVGYLLRFNPLVLMTKKIVEDRVLGEINTATFTAHSNLKKWRNGDYRESVSARKDLGGGVLLELSHEVDLAMWLLSEPTTVLSAQIENTGLLDIDVEDRAKIHASGENGLDLYLDLDMSKARPARGFKIFGTEGELQANLLSGQLSFKSSQEKQPIVSSFAPLDGWSLFKAQMKEFASDKPTTTASIQASVDEGINVLSFLKTCESI